MPRIDELPPAKEVRFLDPQKLRLFRNPFYELCLEIEGEGIYTKVRPVKAFPLTRPHQYIAFYTETGEEIGILPRLKHLPSESKKTLLEELELIYFSPKILSIKKVQSHHGATTWEVETDRGSRTLHVRERGDIRLLPKGRVVITDINGVRFEIENLDQLDERSRLLLEQET